MSWGLKKFVYGVLVCVAVAGFGQQAQATAHAVTCDGVKADDQAAFITALSQGYTSLANGDVIKVTGICAGDYKFLENITITNDAASTSLISTDGFDGMLELLGHTTVNGIMLKGTSLNPANSSNAVDFTSPTSPFSTF